MRERLSWFLRLAMWADSVLSWIERFGGVKVVASVLGAGIAVPLALVGDVALGVITGALSGAVIWVVLTNGGRPLKKYVRARRRYEQRRAAEAELEALRDMCDFEAFGDEPSLWASWTTRVDDFFRKAVPGKLDGFRACRTLQEEYNFVCRALDEVDTLAFRADWAPA